MIFNQMTLGNDLVNIAHAGAKYKHQDQRFLERVFHPEELELISRSVDANLTLWLIWAAKEASFKACQKLIPNLIFSHRKFKINFTKNQNLGSAIYEGLLINLYWQYTPITVHCLAIFNDGKIFNSWDLVNYQIFNINSINYAIESLETRNFAKQYLKSCGFDEQIEIIRPAYMINNIKYYKPPKLFINGCNLDNVEISLSHDHGWGSIAFIIVN